MISRALYKRLERLEARAWAEAVPVEDRLTFVNFGTPGGLTSVRGPDGRQVWWNPPAGCKVGELLEDSENSGVGLVRGRVPNRCRVMFGHPDWGPTTVMGTDGRLVWLKPPEGCKEGEPIEDSAGDPGELDPIFPPGWNTKSDEEREKE